jgi:hypothetical protein
LTLPEFGQTNSERWREETAPQAAVDVPMSAAAEGRAAGDVSIVLLIRVLVAAVATIGLSTAAVLLYRHGVRPDPFPSVVTGTPTVITRYSGPWIGASAAAALLAGLALTSCCVDLFRWVRLRRARRTSGPGKFG